MKIKIGGSASSVKQLTDVDLTFLSDGKVLQYNETTEKWEAVTVNSAGGTVDVLDDLSDVQSASVTTNQILQFDGTNWVTVDADLTGGVSEELEVIGFSINANNEITLGNKGYRSVPYDCEIIDWKIIVNSINSNSIKINITKTSDFTNFTNVITTELDKPQLSNSNFIYSNDMTNWNVSINNNENLRFEIEEVTNIKQVWFFMTIKRII